MSPATVALHVACRRGNLAAVEQALADGASVHARDAEGYDAMLNFACCRRRSAAAYTAVLDRLLSAGANLDSRSPQQDPATHVAASEQRWWLVDLLVERGASLATIPLDENGQHGAWGYHSILSRAVEVGPLSTVRGLLDHGAPVDAASADGHTPLSLAVWSLGTLTEKARRRQMERIVDLLLERGASVLGVPDGPILESPLAVAVKRGSTAMMHRLIDLGAWHQEPRWQAPDNRMDLMHLAIDQSHPEALMRLVHEGLGDDWPDGLWDAQVVRAQRVVALPDHPVLPTNAVTRRRRAEVLSFMEGQQLRRTLNAVVTEGGPAPTVLTGRARL